jgi:hypothetical protein
MITGVAQCGTCIWDPTTGGRLSTCRGCYEKELRPSHPVQLMVGAPLGPDMNSLLAVIRRIISADDSEFDSHALRQDVAELRKLMRGIPE